MKPAQRVQVKFEFVSEDEFAAKQWPDYLVPITHEYTENDFEKQYYQMIERLEKALCGEGWKRGYRENGDFDILEDWYGPHRSLGLGVLSNRVLSPRLVPVLDTFLRSQRDRWMINVSDERWSGSGAYRIDFKMAVEVGRVMIVALNDRVIESLGITLE